MLCRLRKKQVSDREQDKTEATRKTNARQKPSKIEIRDSRTFAVAYIYQH